MAEIIEFKSKKQQFKEWINDIIETNFKDDVDITNALFIWKTNDNDGEITKQAKFNCDLEALQNIQSSLNDYIKEREFDKFLRENIDKYIEYIFRK